MIIIGYLNKHILIITTLGFSYQNMRFDLYYYTFKAFEF